MFILKPPKNKDKICKGNKPVFSMNEYKEFDNTFSYDNMMNVLEKKNIKYEVPNINDTFKVGESIFKVIYLDGPCVSLKLYIGSISLFLSVDEINLPFSSTRDNDVPFE